MHDLGEDLPELLTRLDQLGRVDLMRARYYDDLRTLFAWTDGYSLSSD